ncbi:MAG: choice-of-anchor B family protein [Flavobacteriales bacterium]|nr:choice-of-anchor B family protein [Flavobacteriales bacterium]NUQ13790.1 choice-of-anchor B family protein [Flavobacteriales bacterium]
MIKPLHRTFATMTMALCAGAFHAQVNISLLGHYDYQAARNSHLSNLWGYTDEFGNEYALVGVNGDDNVPNSGGLSVVDITDPANPVEVFFTPGPNSIWREIKTWGDHAYVTTEATAGLLIVDLSPLPQSTNLPVTLFQGNNWDTSHSLFIDENGRLYLHGANRGNGGVIMYDLTQDPMAPVEVGEFDNWYCHDSYARGDTLYAAHINDGFFSIVDVSDPANPVLLGTQTTPNNFSHNTWLDDSGQYLFTTDEREAAFVGVYDVSDPADIQFVEKLQSDPGSNTIPHNTYWLNDFVVTSYYTYGVAIYDATRPWNLVETGSYDTSPLSGGGFNGAWGVYPFLPSGRLIISDIEEGLFILAPTYTHACWLEGTVTDAITTAPVNLASVILLGASTADTTTFDGQYALGTLSPGTYDVAVSAPGYFPDTVTAVVLTTGQVTFLDIPLQPMVPFAFTGQVVEAGTNDPVPGAVVLLDGTMADAQTVADANGQFTVAALFADDYAITAGRWGWHTACLAPQAIDGNTPAVTITLDPGYADDFAVDLGWTATGNAASGLWERGVPVGTTYLGAPCAPGDDAVGDCLGLAMVTGNAGGQAGEDDVDDGMVLLTSPVFDATGFNVPGVRYDRWFFNGGGNGGANDELVVLLTDGTDTVVVETITATSPGMGSWQSAQWSIADHLAPSTTMQVLFRTADDQPGHLVEAAVDVFEVLETSFDAVAEQGQGRFELWPNPAADRFEVRVPGSLLEAVEVRDAQGRMVHAQRASGGHVVVAAPWAPGAYAVTVRTADGRATTATLMLQ